MIAFLSALIASLFADKVEVRENHFLNGYTVTRAVYAWHGGERSFEVLERHTFWTLSGRPCLDA